MPNRTDDFNRSDSTTTPDSPSDAGGNYTVSEFVFGARWGISSNRGYNSSGGVGRATLQSSLADVEVEVTVVVRSTVADGSLQGIVVRRSDDSNYIRFVQNFGNAMSLDKVIADVPTNLDLDAISYADGDTFKVVTNGNSITCYHNGTPVLSATDSFNASATEHGMLAQNTVARFDNLSIVGSAVPAGGNIQVLAAIMQAQGNQFLGGGIC